MPKIDRQKVYDKYDGHCSYCGKKIKFKEMQVDHIVPKCMDRFIDNLAKQDEATFAKYYKNSTYKYARKGLDNILNLNPSCRRCNHYKRSFTVERFRRSMKTLHERIRKIYICKVAKDYGIIEIKPWDGIFYFEKRKEPADG